MIKILDVYSGSEVDTYLRKFSNIIQDVDIPMSPRGVHNEQDWQAHPDQPNQGRRVLLSTFTVLAGQGPNI